MTLKPCRVCGESELLGHTFGFGNPHTFGVRCSRCGHEITTTVSAEEAVWLWNSEGNRDALKPCPLCGGNAVWGREYLDTIIYCQKCGLQLHNEDYDLNSTAKVRFKMVKIWNKRVKE